MTDAPTTRETADHEELAAIISDDEVARVHGHANFGPSITPRKVVDEGVRKYAVGYHSGYTQLTILLEHGLITKPRPGRYDANLTKKGKKYARVLYRREAALLSEIAALRGALVKSNSGFEEYERKFYLEQDAREQAERQRDELRKALETFAEAAESLDDETCDHDHIWEQPAAMLIDAGHLRTARALLANQGADQ